jgi:hypothetical protein
MIGNSIAPRDAQHIFFAHKDMIVITRAGWFKSLEFQLVTLKNVRWV